MEDMQEIETIKQNKTDKHTKNDDEYIEDYYYKQCEQQINWN